MVDEPKGVLGIMEKCEHETQYIIVSGGRSYCEIMKAWTNCRKMGYCTLGKEEPEAQLEIDLGGFGKE